MHIAILEEPFFKKFLTRKQAYCLQHQVIGSKVATYFYGMLSSSKDQKSREKDERADAK